jgi:hypothetical protein
MKRWMLLFALVAPAALAGPYDQVYSIITTETAPTSDHLLLPVIVNRVDGESTMSDNRAVVPPGRHEVVMDVPPRKGFHVATQETLVLETLPCVRYYMAARLDNAVGQNWKPVIRYQEPITECQRKFLANQKG